MGLTTVKEQLTQLVSEHSPDVMVFTETKLTERTQRKSWLRHALKDYWIQLAQAVTKACKNKLGKGLEEWPWPSRKHWYRKAA